MNNTQQEKAPKRKKINFRKIFGLLWLLSLFMMIIDGNIGFVIGIVIGLPIMIFLMSSITLHRQVYCLRKVEIKQDSDIPDYIFQIFSEPVGKLTRLGFEKIHWQRALLPYYDEFTPKWNLVLFHKETCTYAIISSTFLRLPGHPYSFSYVSYFSQPKQVVTISKPWSLTDKRLFESKVYSSNNFSIEEVFNEHKDNVKKSVETIEPLSFTSYELIEIQNKLITNHFNNMLENKRIKKLSDDIFKFSWLGALENAFRGMNLKGLYLVIFKYHMLPVVDVPLDFEVDLYLEFMKMKEYLESKKPPTKSLTTFLISMLITFASFSFLFDYDFQAAIIFILVMLLHELGHFSVMRYFKFKNLNIIFLPFIGAITLGEKKDIPTYQMFLMLISGPVFGLILADFLYYLYPGVNKWLLVSLVFINYLNLLPIVPFDGGRIVDLLITQRFKLFSFIIVIMSSITLFVAGGILDDAFLTFFAGLIGVTAVASLHSYKTHKALMKKLDRNNIMDEKNLVKTIFEASKTMAKHASTRFENKIAIISKIKKSVETPDVSIRLLTLGILLYVLALLLPVGIFKDVYTYRQDIFTYQKIRPSIKKLEKNIKQNPNEPSSYLKLAKIYTENYISLNKAWKLCLKLLEGLDPKYPEAFRRYAEAYYIIGAFEPLPTKEAIKFLVLGNRLFKTPQVFTNPLYNNLVYRYNLKLWGLSEESLNLRFCFELSHRFFYAFRINFPYATDAFEEIGLEYELKGEFNKAIKTYQAMLTIIPIRLRLIRRARIIKRLRVCYTLAGKNNLLATESPFIYWKIFLENNSNPNETMITFEDTNKNYLKQKKNAPIKLRLKVLQSSY